MFFEKRVKTTDSVLHMIFTLSFFYSIPSISVKAARVVLVLVRKLLYFVTGKASFLKLYPYVHKRHQIRNNKLQLGHKYVLNLTKSFILNSRMKAILVCVCGRPTEIIDIKFLVSESSPARIPDFETFLNLMAATSADCCSSCRRLLLLPLLPTDAAPAHSCCSCRGFCSCRGCCSCCG